MSTKFDIEKYGHEMTSPYNDGYTAFHYKQKIIKVILNLLKAIMQNKLNKRNFNLKKMKFKAI